MFKTLRQNRYLGLRKGGFMAFEARELSKRSPRGVPFFKILVKERAEEFKEAQARKLSAAKWEKMIVARYKDNRWTEWTGRVRSILKLDPWKMFRDYEDRYKARYPEYQSPWKKTKLASTDFAAKYKRTVEKQERMEQEKWYSIASHGRMAR